jgi:hypothetical protein
MGVIKATILPLKREMSESVLAIIGKVSWSAYKKHLIDPDGAASATAPAMKPAIGLVC